jgi:DNA-binding response OmpR family regulator
MDLPQKQPREILIVDDNEPTARALAELLLREGYEAAAFTNGSDALAYLYVGSPSAAVIDIHLPDVSGLAICRLIRTRLGPDLPIIIFSGDNSIDTLNALATIGAAHFFNKPVRASELLQRIRELVPV